MSNKSRLEANNTNLQSVLTTVQGLPKVDDVKHGLYAWKKCSVQKELAETTKSNVHISTGASGGASYTYIYADSYSVDLDTGIFTLNNPQTYAGQVMYPPSALKGKYIIAVDASTGDTYTPKTSGNELWFIPSDATLTGGTGYGSADTVTSYKVNILKSVLDFVVSDDPTAYPDGGTQGGYWYEKVVEGVPLTGILGMQKIAVDYFTPTADTYLSGITLTHSLGAVPTTVFIMPVAKSYTLPADYNSYYILFHAFNAAKFISGATQWAMVREAIVGASLKCSMITSAQHSPEIVTSTQFKADTNSGTGGSYLKAGVEYAIITAA